MVGDELQSIYGFRHADLDVFREQRRRVEDEPGSLAIELSGNFRSRPEVIGAVNVIGGHLLGSDTGRCGSGRCPVRRPLRATGPAVELLMTGREGLGRAGNRPAAGDRRPDPAQPARRGALRRLASSRARRRRRPPRARWSSSCAPSPTSTPTRTRSSAPVSGHTSSAAADTGPSSRSATSAPCWRRSPTRSTTGRCSAPWPHPPAASAPTRSGCCAPPRGARRQIWPAIEHLSGAGEVELGDPEILDRIDGADRELLGASRRTGGLRSRAPRAAPGGADRCRRHRDRIRPRGPDEAIRARPVSPTSAS